MACVVLSQGLKNNVYFNLWKYILHSRKKSQQLLGALNGSLILYNFSVLYNFTTGHISFYYIIKFKIFNITKYIRNT